MGVLASQYISRVKCLLLEKRVSKRLKIRLRDKSEQEAICVGKSSVKFMSYN